jgi:hypothetical protein
VVIDIEVVNPLLPGIYVVYVPRVQIRDNIARAEPVKIPDTAEIGAHFRTYADVENTDVEKGDEITVKMGKGEPIIIEEEAGDIIVTGTGIVVTPNYSDPDQRRADNLVNVQI